jgi:uncharacterized protein (DUF2267 family)
LPLGVLLDALFVRPLLIPAMIALMGRFTWWPSRLRPAGSARAFYKEMELRSGHRRAYARDVSRATLVTLSERIPAREADELARRLPGELSELVRSVDHGHSFSADEFVARVAERAGIGTRAAKEDAPLVISALASTLAPGEFEYARAALPGEYAWLFGDAPTPEPRAALTTSG